jgi:transposase
MSNCPMCGKKSDSLSARWYQYDNGEQFRSFVCPSCSKLHDKLVGKND